MAKHLGVQFIYDEPVNEKSASEQLLNAQHLKRLPEALLSELQQAAMSLDIEQSLTVIEQIRAIDAPLADALTERVNQFDFEAVTKLLCDADFS